MIYCDTSFLVALYLKRDAFHLEASSIGSRFQGPMPYMLLSELELINGVHRNFGSKLITIAERDAAFRQIAEDEAGGILVRRALDQTEHYARARDLSKKFTPELSARSLDILHVAAALLLKTSEFATFDEKQRVLVEKAGLKPLPKIIPGRKARKS